MNLQLNPRYNEGRKTEDRGRKTEDRGRKTENGISEDNMEHRAIERRTFTHYMQVLDAITGKLVGHLSDISEGGFRLDCREEIPAGKDFRLFLNLSPEVADKPTLTFLARSRWCKRDPYDPLSFLAGFQIIGMSPADKQIFRRMFELYGEKKKRNW